MYINQYTTNRPVHIFNANQNNGHPLTGLLSLIESVVTIKRQRNKKRKFANAKYGYLKLEVLSTVNATSKYLCLLQKDSKILFSKLIRLYIDLIYYYYRHFNTGTVGLVLTPMNPRI